MQLQELRDHIKQSVIGQDELVNKLSLTIYKHLLKHLNEDLKYTPNNLLILGNTGTGKTYTTRIASKALNLPFIELNAKDLSQGGSWQGKSITDELQKAIKDLESKNIDNIDKTVVFIDEIDKLLLPNLTSTGENVSTHVQASILKIIEGVDITAYNTFNTGGFLFVFAGAFSQFWEKEKATIGFDSKVYENNQPLKDKLIEFGALPEFIGRITSIVKTNDITREFYRDLLLNKEFISNKWFAYLESIGYNKEEVNYSGVITDAVDKNLGVRGLIQAMDEYIDKAIEVGELKRATIK